MNDDELQSTLNKYVSARLENGESIDDILGDLNRIRINVTEHWLDATTEPEEEEIEAEDNHVLPKLK